MKFCIVNADDFGAGTGINRGIVEAHQNGVVTSTSMMVNMPGTLEAAELARSLPRLSVGIHVNLTDEGGPSAVDRLDVATARAEIASQWRRFEELVGHPPTHLDAHHNVHRDPRIGPLFVELAKEKGTPLRENCQVRYFSNFYGQWGGETHPEQISVETLLVMLETELKDGVTELSCHPGKTAADFSSEYDVEREQELATLCDSRVARKLVSMGVHLINYRDFAVMQRSGQRRGIQ